MFVILLLFLGLGSEPEFPHNLWSNVGVFEFALFLLLTAVQGAFYFDVCIHCDKIIMYHCNYISPEFPLLLSSSDIFSFFFSTDAHSLGLVRY